MSEEVCNTHVDITGRMPAEEKLQSSAIRWTRQVDGSYAKEGGLPAEIPTARIFVVDEDDAECAGSKLWPKEEAIALVERKIAEGAYKKLRYEVRPEVSTIEPASAPAVVPLGQPPNSRLCLNVRCKKGPEGTRGIVESRRAKYCCLSCRVAVSRREGRPKAVDLEKPKRKRRSDAKYSSHCERQRAYRARHSRAGLPRAIRDYLAMAGDRTARVTDKATLEPA